AGKLNAVQRRFWEDKREEELYDLQTDPDEVVNLAAAPEHRATLDRLRAALRKHMLETRDNGFIPEAMAPEGYEGSRDDKAYPLAELMDFADVVTKREAANVDVVIKRLADPNPQIRYWSALGCVMLTDKAAPAKA